MTKKKFIEKHGKQSVEVHPSFHGYNFLEDFAKAKIDKELCFQQETERKEMIRGHEAMSEIERSKS